MGLDINELVEKTLMFAQKKYNVVRYSTLTDSYYECLQEEEEKWTLTKLNAFLIANAKNIIRIEIIEKGEDDDNGKHEMS